MHNLNCDINSYNVFRSWYMPSIVLNRFCICCPFYNFHVPLWEVMPCSYPLNLREHEAWLTESHKLAAQFLVEWCTSAAWMDTGILQAWSPCYRIISSYSSIMFSKTEGGCLKKFVFLIWVFRLSEKYRAIAWYIQGPESMWMWHEDVVSLQILALRASTFITLHQNAACLLNWLLQHKYVTQSDLIGAILCLLGTLAVRDLKAYTWQQLQNAQLVPEC